MIKAQSLVQAVTIILMRKVMTNRKNRTVRKAKVVTKVIMNDRQSRTTSSPKQRTLLLFCLRVFHPLNFERPF